MKELKTAIGLGNVNRNFLRILEMKKSGWHMITDSASALWQSLTAAAWPCSRRASHRRRCAWPKKRERQWLRWQATNPD